MGRQEDPEVSSDITIETSTFSQSETPEDVDIYRVRRHVKARARWREVPIGISQSQVVIS